MLYSYPNPCSPTVAVGVFSSKSAFDSSQQNHVTRDFENHVTRGFENHVTKGYGHYATEGYENHVTGGWNFPSTLVVFNIHKIAFLCTCFLCKDHHKSRSHMDISFKYVPS